jgi:hypothetical protein
MYFLLAKHTTTLSQEKRIILVINIERQKLMFTLQKRLCKTLPTNLVLFTLLQYLNLTPWQNLRYLSLESDPLPEFNPLPESDSESDDL